ncbi:hypothetical protein HA052_04265 [Chromobacterium haemolyticum]|uniref:Uncharacterized protein n=1 Tax=Chromobacterium fluminis TaxID=3044269 RepID=A0ABX0KY30_9NEIS|nr:hypothetical protein [Chromobacterium haemolyticum]NHR04405.1 hypothetical protein [Chromobacterium haemolyticum]
MNKSIEIVSKGRIVAVGAEQLDEVGQLGIGWYSYCQARLSRSHTTAIDHLTRFRRA